MTAQLNLSQNRWPVNVVIMAGGKGTRLKTLTEHVHKSLIQVADKPVLGHLVAHLAAHNLTDIHISVGHLAEQIEAYLGRGQLFDTSVSYIHESKPMGSIGALSLKASWQYDHFLVLNGDIVTDFDINHFLSEYFSQEADVAILTIENKIRIAYGVLDVNASGRIEGLNEKPEYSVRVSTGIYAFNKKTLSLIPRDTPIEGWQLMQLALDAGLKMISVCNGDRYWFDIGTHETLQLAERELRVRLTS